MIIPIPKENSYNGPEGRFRAQCKVVREVADKKNPGESKVRLIFDPLLPIKENKKILYGINFAPDLSEGSALREFLKGWIGDEPFKQSEQFDLDTLIGRSVDLFVEHVQRGKHKYPFCNIASASPPGTLVSDAQFRVQQGLPAEVPEQIDLEFKPPDLRKAA